MEVASPERISFDFVLSRMNQCTDAGMSRFRSEKKTALLREAHARFLRMWPWGQPIREGIRS